MRASWSLCGGLIAFAGITACNAVEQGANRSAAPSAQDLSILSNRAEAATTASPVMASRSMLDFMTMDVCVDAGDRAIPGLIPGDGRCGKRRNIRAGETPPYTLHNFGYPGTPCGTTGTIDKTNMPVTRDGVTRIVSTTIRRPGCSTRAAAADLGGDPTAQDGASIQWADDRYGFIMGSYSPVSLSAFQSSLCRDNPRSSRRFFRSWVIAPSPLPAAGDAGVGLFDGAMAKGASRTMMGSCPIRFRKALTTWTVQPFLFKSDRRMMAVVSSHFAQTAPDGLSPGNAMQMERTYWTAEFGISRWEKWTREDFSRKDGKDVATLAAQLVARGRCSAPDIAPVTYSPALQESGVRDANAYIRVLTNPRTGERHRWMMTLCEDYSNARLSDAGNRQVAPSTLASDLYWAP
ncbi:hypothetical protein Q4610_13280 [Sphingobium sp. HBC34]|uniref:Uncharacterized protein n=1 Tax=Sphingobium cyanobacteriorum TaxID=3063954 RepID=A0ABT8ZPW8_9SPHN|nr:hypothetical protein [Sphingobium sp. HBC34]MDO7836019.1 hypothetical protein [Sphingobium sp. HBC34]